MKLADKDEVVSISILHGIRATAEEREAFRKFASAKRRASGEEEADAAPEKDSGEALADVALSDERIAEMEAAEEMVLTVTELGYGKRTSAFEYRVTNRGGSGVTGMSLGKKTGTIVASFPVEAGDQIMLMTDKGTLIRTPVQDIRICGRTSQGVITFRTADKEKVISAVRIAADMIVEDAADDAEMADDAAIDGNAAE
jgi:DNA gyrase subunit A